MKIVVKDNVALVYDQSGKCVAVITSQTPVTANASWGASVKIEQQSSTTTRRPNPDDPDDGDDPY